MRNSAFACVNVREAAQVSLIVSVQRSVAERVPLHDDNLVREFALAHLKQRRPDSRAQTRSCCHAAAKPATGWFKRNRNDNRDANIRGDIKEPSIAGRLPLTQGRDQRLSLGCHLRRQRTTASSTSPPKSYGVALNEFQKAVQCCAFR
jgi:hypothetical protein